MVQAPELKKEGIRHPPIIFKNAYSFVDIRALHRAGKPEQCTITAEGFINGKVAATARNMPSKRNEKIVLTLDSELIPQANGSDIVTVIASITDKDGFVKRPSQETVIFEVEGEGELIGGREIKSNPRVSRWRTAPALIRTSKIKVTTRLLHPGIQLHPVAALEFTTTPTDRPSIYKKLPVPTPTERFNTGTVKEIDHNEIEREEEERINEMKKVEQQQRHFESTEKK